MKKLLKWLAGLVLLLVVLAVILLLSRDSILRAVAEHRIRAQTGMDAEIGQFHVGLLEPVITIRNFKIYNPPAFGGAPFLDIKEIHAEYDRDALLKNRLHLTLLRFNLGELDIVKNQAGQTNIFALGVTPPAQGATNAGPELAEFQKRTGLKFTGIDVLNVSVGEARFIDLQDPKLNRDQPIGIDNFVMKDVKTPADLAGLAVLVALRGGDFFNSVFGSSLRLF